MRIFCVSLFLVVTFNIYASDELINEYNILFNDLKNYETSGYKSSWDIERNKGGDKVNFSQGALMTTESETNFSILGEGFFKIKLENGMIGYTRHGDFRMGFDDSESEFTLRTARYGYKLYDSIIIPDNMVRLRLEGNILYAVLFNGTKIETGQVNVYEIDSEKLIRHKDGFFITSDNYDSQIKKDSRIVSGCLEMSNVNILQTLMRMYFILCELKNYGDDYDNKIHIILMLINNIQILNELSIIKFKLLDQWPPYDSFSSFSGFNLLNNSLDFIRIE
jgi:flagellar basal body rod protein FlgF